MEEEEPEEEEEDEVVTHRGGGASHPASRASINAPRHLLDGGEEREGGGDDDGTIAGMRAGGSGMVNTVIAERESAYQAKGRRNQMVCCTGLGVDEWPQGGRWWSFWFRFFRVACFLLLLQGVYRTRYACALFRAGPPT